MKLTINLSTMSVAKVPAFDSIAGIRNNSQHCQLDGHALVEVSWGGHGVILNCFHPETSPATGHIDVSCHISGEEVVFRQYSHCQVISLLDRQTASVLWPHKKGFQNLLKVCVAVEEFLEEEMNGYAPQIMDWLMNGGACPRLAKAA